MTKTPNWIKYLVKSHHARTEGCLYVGEDEDRDDIDETDAKKLIRLGLISKGIREPNLAEPWNIHLMPKRCYFTPEGLVLVDKHRPQ